MNKTTYIKKFCQDYTHCKNMKIKIKSGLFYKDFDISSDMTGYIEMCPDSDFDYIINYSDCHIRSRGARFDIKCSEGFYELMSPYFSNKALELIHYFDSLDDRFVDHKDCYIEGYETDTLMKLNNLKSRIKGV